MAQSPNYSQISLTEHVVTDISQTYNSDPVNVYQPTSSTSVDPCVSENRTVKISSRKRHSSKKYPPDYFGCAIYACLFCCLLFGLVAIVAANKRHSSEKFPPGYFGLIFHACLFCCLPFGLVAMLAAKKGLKATACGVYDTARRYNCTACTLTDISVHFLYLLTGFGIMAQSSNYGKVKLNEHMPQSYSSIEVQSDEPDKSSTYHDEDDNKQPSHTLLENQQFTDTESSSAYNKVTTMVNPEVDSTRPYITVEHITVVTDLSSTYNGDPDQTHVCCLMYDEDPPDNASYLCLAMFASCCCFWPFAAIAICNASQASTVRARGDVNAAKRYNKMAYTWIRLSIGVGSIFLIVSLYIHFFRMI
ncbi:PRRT1 [Mytilus coruscus]|uniref:PRRT1 n=1 Tax=Mytilus coruscus TaxID=42192 RepID=A0A6J8E1V5_MYTCO|nr:PRRT1 [Mytilus coruscus]